MRDVLSVPLFVAGVKVSFFVARVEFQVGVLAPEDFGGKSPSARIWSHLLCLCVICIGNCEAGACALYFQAPATQATPIQIPYFLE